MGVSWTGRLWAEAEGTYRAILGHPFLSGLTDGSLDEDCFAYYIAQDAYYLRDYARALAIVAAKAPTHADTGLFARHAAETVAVELALHETLLAALSLDRSCVESTPVSPTTTAYTSYLLAVAYGGTFADGLATVLPCYWIYQRVGAALVAQGSPNPRYQQWINTYAGDAFAATVAEVLEVADRVGSTLDAAQDAHARCHFATKVDEFGVPDSAMLPEVGCNRLPHVEAERARAEVVPAIVVRHGFMVADLESLCRAKATGTSAAWAAVSLDLLAASGRSYGTPCNRMR